MEFVRVLSYRARLFCSTHKMSITPYAAGYQLARAYGPTIMKYARRRAGRVITRFARRSLGKYRAGGVFKAWKKRKRGAPPNRQNNVKHRDQNHITGLPLGAINTVHLVGQDITRGVNINNRIGDKIWMKGIHYMLFFENQLASHIVWIKFMIVKEKTFQFGEDEDPDDLNVAFFKGESTTGGLNFNDPVNFGNANKNITRIHHPINKKRLDVLYTKTIRLAPNMQKNTAEEILIPTLQVPMIGDNSMVANPTGRDQRVLQGYYPIRSRLTYRGSALAPHQKYKVIWFAETTSGGTGDGAVRCHFKVWEYFNP